MQIILTPVQMRAFEERYFQSGRMSSSQLMGRAASELVRVMDERGLVRGKRIAFLCGTGGNGGDGLAAAALCHVLGAQCLVVLAQPAGRYTGDALHYLQNLPDGVVVCPLHAVGTPDVWVDALFGIGLNRPVSGLYAECIEQMNASDAPVVSVDIPSGIDGLTGDILGCAVEADVTVTFQHPKPGHFLRHGMDFSGELMVCDIGIPSEFLQLVPPLEDQHPFLLQPEDSAIAAMLPRRRHFSHKNTHGHLLLIAGSRGMAGAAAMAACAALHSGVGLLTIACPKEIVPILQTLAPEAMCLPLPQDENGCISADAVETLTNAFTGKSAVAIGPGLSRNLPSVILQTVAACGLPAVFDADALRPTHWQPYHIITPHPGEAARLLQPSRHEIDDALRLHDSCPQVIYKGAASIIATDDGLYLSDTGSPCMAKGGSGDVLTGIAGALLARGMSAAKAAVAASHVHGRAGEAAARKHGLSYPTAMDLIACLSEVWQALGQ